MGIHTRHTAAGIGVILMMLASPVEASEKDAPLAPGIDVYGALHRIMKDADFSAAVTIGPAVSTSTTFGVGAVAGLRGEITLVGGRCWVSRVEDGTLKTRIDDGDGVEAALLVVADVSEWAEFPLTEAVDLESLAGYIQDLAAGLGINDEPLVFRVSTLLPALEGHVIDGSRITPEMSHAERHERAVDTRRFSQQPGTLVGFVSNAHQGVFTHRGEAMHMHAVLVNDGITAHVDAVVLPAGTVVELGLTTPNP